MAHPTRFELMTSAFGGRSSVGYHLGLWLHGATSPRRKRLACQASNVTKLRPGYGPVKRELAAWAQSGVPGLCQECARRQAPMGGNLSGCLSNLGHAFVARFSASVLKRNKIDTTPMPCLHRPHPHPAEGAPLIDIKFCRLLCLCPT